MSIKLGVAPQATTPTSLYDCGTCIRWLSGTTALTSHLAIFLQLRVAVSRFKKKSKFSDCEKGWKFCRNFHRIIKERRIDVIFRSLGNDFVHYGRDRFFRFVPELCIIRKWLENSVLKLQSRLIGIFIFRRAQRIAPMQKKDHLEFAWCLLLLQQSSVQIQNLNK